jgi:hypothetical protein
MAVTSLTQPRQDGGARFLERYLRRDPVSLLRASAGQGDEFVAPVRHRTEARQVELGQIDVVAFRVQADPIEDAERRIVTPQPSRLVLRVLVAVTRIVDTPAANNGLKNRLAVWVNSIRQILCSLDVPGCFSLNAIEPAISSRP